MNEIVIVALRELKVMLRRPLFYIATFVMPLILGSIILGSSIISNEVVTSLSPGSTSAPAWRAGVIDQAGVIGAIPPAMERFLIVYRFETDAAKALRAGSIESYFLIGPDYQATGRVVRVARQATLTSATAPDTSVLVGLLRARAAGDPRLAQRFDRPPDLQIDIVGAPERPRPQSQPQTGVAMALAWLLAFSILNGGGWLVQAVAEEKENRTIEIMLTSVRPRQLMIGKVVGLGAATLLQLGIWSLIGYGLLGTQRLADQVQLGAIAPSTWGWMIVFFLFGFLLYGAIMAALGAVGASARESGQVAGFLLMPVLVPLWFGAALAESAESTLALVLSLVPFTAPVAMMLRLGGGSVPAWQLLSSLVLLASAALGTLWLAARLFRATTLLAGVKPTPRMLWRSLQQA